MGQADWIGVDMGESTAPKYRSVIMVDGVPHKKCPDCEETKPIEEGFGWRIEDGSEYPISVCRACRAWRARMRRLGYSSRKTMPPPPAVLFSMTG